MTTLRPLGDTGLRCHLLGFGCYRIEEGNAEQEAALRDYLDRGGNLIDTSANYGDGLSEAMVGRVLQDRGRDGVILVTKGGYVQGSNMDLAQERDFPEVVEYGPGIWHCIHPDYLATQIERSSQRLQVERIDIYLLHNPEYYLEQAAQEGPLRREHHEEFYRRVREAFGYLESQAAAGRIGWYGVSSNNFGRPAFDRHRPSTMTSVSRCLTEAVSVTSDHHFRVVQLPLNLYEAGGALERNNEGRTVLEFCSEEGLGVLANRPLNAFRDKRMVRLADWVRPGASAPGPEDLHAMLQPIEGLEAELERDLGERLPLEAKTALARGIEEIVLGAGSEGQWERLFAPRILRPLGLWIAQCRERHGGERVWVAWEGRFLRVLNDTLEEVSRFLMVRQQPVSDEVRRRLEAAGYADPKATLSRLALNVLAGLDGLTCALVGMRRRAYVEDAMGVEEMERVDGLEVLRRS